MIERSHFLHEIRATLTVHPICGLLGPRQCGKTTLAKQFARDFNGLVHHFDLENPLDLAKLETPKLTLAPLTGLVIIDEIQRRPNLFPYLRVLADEQPDCKFLILGSASRELIQQSSESLAGRIGYIELTPFLLSEVGLAQTDQLWCRGGFPGSYLAASEEYSQRWRADYISTFLERDLGTMGFNISPQHMRRLWMMLAHYHGNTLNYAELGRSLTLTDAKIRQYIDILAGTYMVRVLPAWFENISKRQVKAPKIFMRDSGLLNSLLGIDAAMIRMHPKTGAAWEGFALEQVIQTINANDQDCYYWGSQHQAELDLFVVKYSQRQGFEFKYTDSPKTTKSMHSVLNDLKLELITLIIPGEADFYLHEKIRVQGLVTFVQAFMSREGR